MVSSTSKLWPLRFGFPLLLLSGDRRIGDERRDGIFRTFIVAVKRLDRGDARPMQNHQ